MGSESKNKLRPSHSALTSFKKKKLSVLLIKNGDKLCCARTIITAKARVDQHPNWDGFKRGRRIQAEHAVDLHHETRVPRGPCGYDELRAFPLAPSLYDYQILLCNATRRYVVTSFGPPSLKQLVLLYDDGHYNVITSLPGFFGTSYFCMRCLKPYNNQGHHACDNNPDHCSAYLQTGCLDYTEAQCRSLPVTQTCDSCRWTFCGTACFTNHVSKTQTGKTADHQQLSVCTNRRKCGNCHKLLVGRKQQQEHLCGYITCPSCHHYIKALSQRCFIQVAKPPEEERGERHVKRRPGCRLRDAAAGLATVHSNEDDVPSTSLLPSPPADGVDLNDEKPPLHVFFNVEAMHDTGRHVWNLVMAKTENDEHPVRFQGGSCMRDFSNSSSRGVSPSSLYSSLWLDSIPFPTSPSPLLATRISNNNIANKPLHGWHLNTNHSRVALEWLHWQQHQLPDEDDYIQHAGNSGKYKIPHSQYTVDGYHEKTNTVYDTVQSAIPIATNPTAALTIGALTTCTVACRSNSTYCVIEVSG